MLKLNGVNKYRAGLSKFNQFISGCSFFVEVFKNNIQFYKNLKDNIKDDLYKEDILNILIEYIQRTIKIDNHLYIYRIEKRG